MLTRICCHLLLIVEDACYRIWCVELYVELYLCLPILLWDLLSVCHCLWSTPSVWELSLILVLVPQKSDDRPADLTRKSLALYRVKIIELSRFSYCHYWHSCGVCDICKNSSYLTCEPLYVALRWHRQALLMCGVSCLGSVQLQNQYDQRYFAINLTTAG